MARVVIYEPVLTAMSSPGGSVFKWAYQRRKRVERLAKLYAPKATGNMARQITGSYDKVPNGVIMYVTSPAWYSIYPHEGTGPYASRQLMKIPNPAGPRPYTYSTRRRGQRAKPFLTQALDTVMADL